MTVGPGIVICGGDWNIHLDPKLDRSKPSSLTPLHKKLKALMSDLGIIDLWRDFHPSNHNYTHYSYPHGLYARIDYFFIFNQDRHRMENCEIGNIDLSDHAPLSLSLKITNNIRNTLWRLNTSILNNEQFKLNMKQEIVRIIAENDNGEVGFDIVWDTLKAILRGKIISYCSFKKKERQAILSGLNKELDKLETEHKRDPQSVPLLKLKKTRREIDEQYSQEIKKKISVYKAEIL